MEEVAERMFLLGDTERKGFIVKRDMQRLRSEVSFSPEQLEAVFESLDPQQTGYITLDQFLEGFGRFSSSEYAGGKSRNNMERTGPDSTVRAPKCAYLTLEHSQPVTALSNIAILEKSSETLHRLSNAVRAEGTERVKSSFDTLMQDLCSDLSNVEQQIAQLEHQLTHRDQQHTEQVRKLYEELENQVAEEKEILTKQNEQRESLVRSQLGKELELKDRQLAELEEQKRGLREQLMSIRSREAAVKIKNNELIRSQEVKESAIEKLKMENRALQKHLERLKKKSVLECDKFFQNGFRLAQRVATIHEQGLLEELGMLQEMEATLSQ